MLDPRIFKANDIRGIVTGKPEWDCEGATLLGAAYAELLQLDGREFLLGRDMRTLGRELASAFSAGARSRGASVVDLGLTATDQMWFASGHYGLPGVQLTASHNPASYNGMKFCDAGAQPVAEDFTAQLRQLAERITIGTRQGGYRSLDIMQDYAEALRKLVPPGDSRELVVLIDAGNGMAGNTALPVLAGRGLDIIGLYFELDGSFPNHPPNPLDPANLEDAQRCVVDNHADLGLVFDGDADRCFMIDERGDVIDPSLITAMIAMQELTKHPGGTIVVNTITSQAVKDAVAGTGEVVTSRVGHNFVKAAMTQHNAVFGGEHSAHFYFRDFFFADAGMLAALHVIEALRASKVPMSQLVRRYDTYARSGELNFTVSDTQACLRRVAEAFPQAHADWGDGVTLTHRDQRWWVNVRPSNTEPLVRVNVEAPEVATMAALRDRVLRVIAS